MFTITYQCAVVLKERKEVHLSDVLLYNKVNYFNFADIYEKKKKKLLFILKTSCI